MSQRRSWRQVTDGKHVSRRPPVGGHLNQATTGDGRSGHVEGHGVRVWTAPHYHADAVGGQPYLSVWTGDE